MKTSIINFKTILPLLMLVMAMEAPARELPSVCYLSEESYVDDIPFDTKSVVFHSGISPFALPEEGYVDDIPFSTRSVVTGQDTDSLPKLNEESYIDDIPFDTEKIYNEYLLAGITDEYRNEPETTDNVAEDCQKIATCRMFFNQPIHHSSPIQVIRISESDDYLMITYPGKDKEQIFRIPSISAF